MRGVGRLCFGEKTTGGGVTAIVLFVATYFTPGHAIKKHVYTYQGTRTVSVVRTSFLLNVLHFSSTYCTPFQLRIHITPQPPVAGQAGERMTSICDHGRVEAEKYPRKLRGTRRRPFRGSTRSRVTCSADSSFMPFR